MQRTLSTRPVLAAAVILLVLVVSACSSPAPAGLATPPPDGAPTGGLVAQQASVDLGRVPFNVPAEGRFDLSNTGTRPIKLLAVPEVKMLEGC